MEPFTDIEKAKQFIQNYEGKVKDFSLPIPDSMNDPVGINMAILLDLMLKKDWEPDGFDQYDGYRVYKYKTMD